MSIRKVCTYVGLNPSPVFFAPKWILILLEISGFESRPFCSELDRDFCHASPDPSTVLFVRNWIGISEKGNFIFFLIFFLPFYIQIHELPRPTFLPRPHFFPCKSGSEYSPFCSELDRDFCQAKIPGSESSPFCSELDQDCAMQMFRLDAHLIGPEDIWEETVNLPLITQQQPRDILHPLRTTTWVQRNSPSILINIRAGHATISFATTTTRQRDRSAGTKKNSKNI